LGVGHYRVLFDWESTIKAVSLMVDRVTPIRAWREYLDLTQEEVAKRLGISSRLMRNRNRSPGRLVFGRINWSVEN
jgi:predicted DNA-binding protein (UPF0251 family)